MSGAIKNEQQILPLDKSSKIAVIGPNAHHYLNQLGDYTDLSESTRYCDSLSRYL